MFWIGIQSLLRFLKPLDLSETQQQLLDINQRYEIIGERLIDRQNELHSVLAAIKGFCQDMSEVTQWLEVKDKQMTSDCEKGIPASEKAAKTMLKEHEVCRKF